MRGNLTGTIKSIKSIEKNSRAVEDGRPGAAARRAERRAAHDAADQAVRTAPEAVVHHRDPHKGMSYTKWFPIEPFIINPEESEKIVFTGGNEVHDRRLHYLDNGTLKRLITETLKMTKDPEDQEVVLPFKSYSKPNDMEQHLVLVCTKMGDGGEWSVKIENNKNKWNEAKIKNSGKCKSLGICGNLQAFLHDQYVFDKDGTIYYTRFIYGGGQERNNRGIYRRNKKKKTSKRKRKITKRKKKSLKKTKRR
jgi:hypothetical protein